MSTNEFYKPVGGILSAELFPTRELSSIEHAIAGRGIAVYLMDDGSLYEESFVEHDGLVSVEHTLTLCSDRHLSQAWFDEDFLQRAAVEGVAARILLATGEELTLGWSERFGFEQTLRLRSLSFDSGSQPNDSPRTVLTLVACDTHSALT
jgi:hypothetical protein